jgi:hypothetical protein
LFIEKNYRSDNYKRKAPAPSYLMADNSHPLSTIDSEKITAKKTRLITCLLFSDKLPSILTFVSAVIAFSLSLVVLLSGAEKGQLQDYEVVVVCFSVSSIFNTHHH